MKTTPQQRWVLAGTTRAVVAFSALRFDGPRRGDWDTDLAVPAMVTRGQPVDLHRMDGTPRSQEVRQGVAVLADVMGFAARSAALRSPPSWGPEPRMG